MSRARRPLYLRLLRVRHLNPRPLVTLALFEGSIALGLLLTLAGLVSNWAMVIVPIAVALAVKLNDVIAGTMIRPLALAQLRTPRPGDATAVGRSPIPRPSYPTTWIEGDDAVADPAARPSSDQQDDREPDRGGDSDRGPGARGVASVPETNRLNGARPRPDVSTGELPIIEEAEPAEVAGPSVESTGPMPQAHSPNVRPAPARDESVRPDGADRRSRGNTGRFT